MSKKIGNLAFVTKLAGFEHTKYIQFNATHEKNDIPLIIGKNVKNGRMEYVFDWYISNEISSLLPRSALNKKCIVIPYVGSKLGDLAIFNNDFKCHLGSNVSKVELNNEDEILLEYLYYYLKSPYGQAQLFKGKQGSAQPNITMDAIRNTALDIKSLDTQKNIVNILKSIDDKIDINIAITKKLEMLAKTLYDYWFIQFDFPDENNKPYRTSGGSMVYNEVLKRAIPVGWEIDNLYRIADYFNGLACQKHRPNENEAYLPVVKIEEMHNGITNETEFVSLNIPDKNKIYAGDILFSWSATLEVIVWTGIDAGLNQHIFKVVPKPSYTKEYVYQQLSAYVNNFVRIAEARKTTMGHITTDHLEQSKIVIPPTELINKYTEKVKDIYKQMILCKQENLSLANLRDFLLPMLMNGQITVMVSDEDDLSEDKIIEKSLEFWQTHGKMDIDQFARENGILVYKDNEQKKGAVSYNAEKDLYEIAVKDPRDNFTIAHEIGHILKHKKELKNGTLGRKSEESGSKIMEYEADSLAAEILMPEEYVLQYMQDENKTNKEFLDEKFIKECAKHFDVNPPAMNIRLKNLGFKTPYIR